jgi:uncharacterized protein (DUF433 family)
MTTDMTEAYSAAYRAIAHKVAQELGFVFSEGVYAAVLGPNYETPAEIRYLRAIGADLVGMSTVPEVIMANYLGMRVLAISCVTNMAAGVLPQKLNHEESAATFAARWCASWRAFCLYSDRIGRAGCGTMKQMASDRLSRITIDDAQCGGRPCIRGLRMRVSDVLELLSAGASVEEIVEDYPYLEREDILAALEYAARQADHAIVLSA